MLKAYTVRPEYEDANISGIIKVGLDDTDNDSMDVAQALAEGKGEILTEDPLVQTALDNYQGALGPVFEATIVTDGGGRVAPEEADPSGAFGEPTTVVVGEQAPEGTVTESETLQDVPSRTMQEIPAAVHSEGSGYEALTKDELRQTLEARGINMPAKSTNQDLIAALEQDDLNRQEGASNGS